ncbi:hypothetical protein HPP92_011187 [Vanilla planifolia]|uniref:Uncharacterized protein n=1 Tax=Vanilla planifolia TaxID=51239 RepID=A0A835R3S6_VANPL|nr:hypothetical protein HPP92_011187 [Vanilla planifolia]
MPNQNKDPSSVATVVSTGCSMLSSCMRQKRSIFLAKPPIQTLHDQPTAPLSLHDLKDGRPTSQAHSLRAKQLDLELHRIDLQISADIREKKAALLRTTRLVADRSFLHEVSVGRPWTTLVMQVSQAALADKCFSAEQVIKKMASMAPEELLDYLSVALPMSEMRGCRKEKLKVKQLISGWEVDVAEDIVLGEMERIEELALEGLRIQMGSGGRAAAEGEKKDAGKKCVVLVTRIKMRDPEAEYDAVGEAMLGFVEVSPAAAGWRKHSVEGVRVAGISRNGKGGPFMWTAALEVRKGLHGNGRSNYVRKREDIPFCQAK